jgi:hypothetical protein
MKSLEHIKLWSMGHFQSLDRIYIYDTKVDILR